MPISFSCKETLAFIAKSIVIASSLAQGTPLTTAEYYAGLLESTIKGFNHQSGAMSINRQLNNTIQSAIDKICCASEYEIPLECVEPLMVVFSPG